MKRKERQKKRNGKLLWFRTGLVGISLVEVADQFMSMGKFVGGKPGCFFVGAFVTSPADKVKELAMAAAIYFSVKYLSNFILNVTINLNWRRRFSRAAGN